MLNYHIEATDGLIGHVKGFLVDAETWAIRRLIVKTSHRWLGHRVLIVSDWITSVNWLERTVRVDLSRAAIKEAPPFEAAEEFDYKQLDHQQQVGTYKHQDQSGYRTGQFQDRF